MPISLFYHYTEVNDTSGTADRLRTRGTELQLGGRIRVSPEGINGTLGGTSSQVAAFHQAVLHEFPNADIDFKIADDGNARHFGHVFRVRTCSEVVTLGSKGEGISFRDAAPHVTAEEFRSEVLEAGCGRSGGEPSIRKDRDVVILDARNAYEHAIGHFDNAILPNMRQFSDFGAFIENNRKLFDNRRVLMYCTGGVRCEKASALVRRDTNAASVAQLRGGIDAFLRRYPDGGGVFRGRNLVFDGRGAVGKCAGDPVGRCVVCEAPWDDYVGDWRCAHCRGRVLVCGRSECEEFWAVGVSRGDALCRLCAWRENGQMRGANTEGEVRGSGGGGCGGDSGAVEEVMQRDDQRTCNV